ncbi:serine/threonine-protein kinase/endoribonuclease IRE1a-like, partial [Trifolium medium]|nr:serine/threonine-protein kinase/endoribonuclease IRE1a-like [Trifolium medium]
DDGSEGWRCPERSQCVEGIKSDMFNLGLVIFYCFVGRHPFGDIKDSKPTSRS